jgi:hypothetical protein
MKEYSSRAPLRMVVLEGNLGAFCQIRCIFLAEDPKHAHWHS